LYTTNRLADFPICAVVGVTSRTPTFRREDVAERLLPIYLERLETFGPEADILARIQREREPMLGSLIKDLWHIVRALRDQSGVTHRTEFRMADFADFVLKVAHANSREVEAGGILERLAAEQVAFAAEDEPLVDLIENWLINDEHVNVEREVGAVLLGSELATMVEKPWLLPWDYKNPRSFAQYLRSHIDSLRRHFEVKERSGHGGVKLYSFAHRRRDISDG
jgi:hypothetical protein